MTPKSDGFQNLRLRRIFLILIFGVIMLMFSSCDTFFQNWFDQDTKAVIEAKNEDRDTIFYIGNPIILDGSKSECGMYDQLSFNWILQTPSGSNSMLEIVTTHGNEVLSKKTFTPDIPGIYTVYMTVIDDDDDSDVAILIIEVRGVPSSSPPNFVVQSISTNSISLSWNAVAQATNYRVSKGTSIDGPFSTLVYSGATLTCSDDSLEPGTSWFYVVTAENPAGSSAPTTPLIATTRLDSPNGFRVVSNTLESVHLTWNEVPHADGYRVQKSKFLTSEFVDAYSEEATECTTDNLSASPIWYFRLRAEIQENIEATSDWVVLRVNLNLQPPAIPEEVQMISGTSSSLVIDWEDIENTDFYRIYRATSENGNYTLVKDTVIDSNCIIDNLTAGTSYWFKVGAVSSLQDEEELINLEGGLSSPCEGITIPLPPSQVSIISITDTSVIFDCLKPQGSTEIVVFKQNTLQLDPVKVSQEDISWNGDQCTITNLTHNTAYDFRFKAKNRTGEGEFSNPISIQTTLSPLDPPGGVISSEIGTSSVLLQWNEVQDANAYAIYAGTVADQKGELIRSVETNSYTVQQLTANTTWYFSIATINADSVEGSVGETKQVLTLPEAPLGLRVEQVNPKESTLLVSWNAIPSVTGYRLYRESSEFGPFDTHISNLPSSTPQHKDETLPEDSPFYYRVSAINATGEGPKSPVSSGRTALVATDPPNLTTIEVTCNYVKLEWSTVPGCTYKVYRDGGLLEPTADTNYYDYQITPGQSYTYKVKSVTSSREGVDFSNIRTATIPTVNVSMPNGGSFKQGQSLNVQWNKNGDGHGSTTKVVLKSGSTSKTIASATTSNEISSWTIPLDQSVGTYYIEVTDIQSGATGRSEQFNIISNKGTLRIKVLDQNGRVATDASVKVYTPLWHEEGSSNASSSGIASFNLVEGYYNVEIYHRNHDNNLEYWGNRETVLVLANDTQSYDVQRNTPYVEDFRVYRSTNNADVTGQTISPYDGFYNKLYITNSSSSGYSVRVVNYYLDRNRSSSYDYSTSSSEEWINARTSGKTITFYPNISTEGTYYRKFVLQTKINGNWVMTDSWDWGTAITLFSSAYLAKSDWFLLAKTIPDAGGWNNFLTVELTTSGAPSAARIKKVEVRCLVYHQYVGDLVIQLTTYQNGRWYDGTLRSRSGGSADDINTNEVLTNDTTWTGLDPNATWYLKIGDFAYGDEGKLKQWEIKVYY